MGGRVGAPGGAVGVPGAFVGWTIAHVRKISQINFK